MHIKSLKIQGFKSYRDETLVDPFSPGLNLLVGRNGSGKSNFFSAIRFVLSDAYTSLTREERQALLHDGASAGGGGATMSAFVEIEFDNEDGRFPTNKPTLLLRRTIGLKKDEYQMDRKSTSKGEVMSVLESAGFSRSNPYYIVPQGRITHLTNQKDVDRLALLKEVAGTKVYEERRAESTKIMDETNVKIKKIADLLQFINDRLSELEEEKEELKQFQVQDRARRSLEYSIYQRELKDIAEALEAIEEERRRDIDNANTRREEFNSRQAEIAGLDATLAAHRQRLEILSIEHRQTSGERREAVKAKAEVECFIRDAEEEGKRGFDRLGKLERELKKVEADINDKKTELMEAVPAWEDKVAEEKKAKERLEVVDTKLRTLVGKQGRTTQFKSQKERDAHLRKEIESRKGVIGVREKRAEEVKKDLGNAKGELENAEKRWEEGKAELDERKEVLRGLAEEWDKYKKEEVEKSEKRKDLWKHESRLESTVKHAADQLKQAEQDLFSTMDRDTSRGLKSAKAIAERLGLVGNGYHGAIYELFTVDDRYKTAVEVTAGTSLFQIVVDTDDVATKILDVMLKERSGRITFIPLNRLKDQHVDYPQAKDAIALIKKLDYKPQFTKAFQQVFGKTIVCQTLEIAGAYTRSHNLNSITLEGDKYDRKGALSGGYHDESRSRLDAVRHVKTWEEKFNAESAQLAEVKTALTKLDQEITAVISKAQVVDGKRKRLVDERQALVEGVMGAQNDVDRVKTRIARLEANLEDQESSARMLKTEIQAYEEELKTKMTQALSGEEVQEMEDLQDEAGRLKRELVDLSASVGKLASTKALLEVDLNENLSRRREELRGKVEAFDGSAPQEGPSRDLDARRAELESLEAQIEELSRKIGDVETETESLNEEVANAVKRREQMDGQQADDSRNLAKQQKNVERYLNKKQMLEARKNDCNKNIRELGVLPEEAFIENTTSSEKLLKKLRKVNEALKGFAHVNKKAYEQYTSFTKQRDELIERQTELEDSATSITDLIDALDARKDEAIERTFKQVAKYFEEVFEKLVPAGRGRLIMLKREMAKDDDMDVDGEEEENEGGVENYTGVAIRVSFNSKNNEGLKIQQLSGGQKALVALAMIFAIQKCDPAPFYLFDEIDANLDADRRTGVAAMIDELSQTGQYICTTFRPELIPHAESYFGVVFNNSKISNVKSISADECLTFVEAAEQIRG
ncbi:chromosome segregation protein, SudA [Pseudohyphozyma bogoriensis]|nr:chromosome segregation protein, SudA [Pseudohyphozyma bogoriensis]